MMAPGPRVKYRFTADCDCGAEPTVTLVRRSGTRVEEPWVRCRECGSVVATEQTDSEALSYEEAAAVGELEGAAAADVDGLEGGGDDP